MPYRECNLHFALEHIIKYLSSYFCATPNSDDGSVSSAFTYSGGTYTSLAGPTGSISTNAVGISDTGVIVGSYATSLNSPVFGFIYEGGNYATFNVSGAISTTLRGISPDGRYLSGYFEDASDRYGFLFDRVTSTTFTIGSPMIVQGINSHAVLVGSFQGRRGTPFTYDIATSTRADYGPAGDRYRDINDDGLIAGWRGAVSVGAVAIVGSPGSFEEFTVVGASSTFAEGINNAGWVVGNYDVANLTTHAFIARPVPEPESWALMFAGLVAVGAVARRRRA